MTACFIFLQIPGLVRFHDFNFWLLSLYGTILFPLENTVLGFTLPRRQFNKKAAVKATVTTFASPRSSNSDMYRVNYVFQYNAPPLRNLRHDRFPEFARRISLPVPARAGFVPANRQRRKRNKTDRCSFQIASFTRLMTSEN